MIILEWRYFCRRYLFDAYLFSLMRCSNLTNKYNPQERTLSSNFISPGSNLTNKYNPQEPIGLPFNSLICSNLTNKYNPQELTETVMLSPVVQILPINTILKNYLKGIYDFQAVQILPINTILKN